MARIRAKYSVTVENIEAINRRWVRRATSYEPVHRYGGDPYIVRCEAEVRAPEPNLKDCSHYR